MEDTTAVSILKELDRMKSERYNYHKDLQDIVSLVRPNATDFEYNDITPGNSRTLDIYDSTPVSALVDMASGMQAFLTNPQDRWFSLTLRGIPHEEIERDAAIWLEDVTNLIYGAYARPESNHQHSLQEAYLDIGSLGTACINQEFRNGTLVFRPDSLGSFWIKESDKGLVDTRYSECKKTIRQIRQQFGDKAITKEMENKAGPEGKQDDFKFTIVHAVQPNTDKQKGVGARGMKFSSVWVCKDTKQTLKRGGYKSFPFHIPRWSNRSGEVYGRSPVHDCLPDIRMLNRMELNNIKATEKAVNPPYVVPHDGFFGPLDVSPGSVNYAETNEPGKFIHALRFEGDLNFGESKAEQKRESIKHCLMADLFILELKKAEMTATEVQDRREEQLRRLAPVLGKVTRELLAPMIERSYELLRDNGKLPSAPESLQGYTLDITYDSPAVRAQRGIPALEMQRWIESLMPVAQLDPSVMDALDVDAYASELARLRGVSPKIIKSLEAMQRTRTQRAQSEQAAQLMQAAEPASKALLNVASANEKGGAQVPIV